MGLYSAVELAKEKLVSSHEKMKGLYDLHAKQHVSFPGEVLALLPIVGLPLQAKFMGPYIVVKQLTEQNYLNATPEHCKNHQLCHVNLLKPYHARVPQEQGGSAESAHPVCLSNTELSDCSPLCEYGLPGHDSVLLTRRLTNSDVLVNLSSVVGHLSEAQCTELAELIGKYTMLFGDVPSHTHVLEHEIDVGDEKPMKQHFYHCNPEKQKFLDLEVDHILRNGTGEPSASRFWY